MSVEEFTYLRGRTTKPVKVTLLSAQQAAAYYDPDKSSGRLRDARRLPRRPRRLHAPRDRRAARASAASTCRSTRRSTRRSSTRRSAKATASAAAIRTRCSTPASSSTTRSSTGHPGVTFGIHICRGNHKSMFYASGGYDRIAEQVFSRAKFDRFLLEYDDERSGTFEPLRHVPDDRVVVLGLVSSKTPRMETVGGAARRASPRPRAIVPLERLALSPQCGFASTHEGNALTEAEQRQKLELVADGARSVGADERILMAHGKWKMVEGPATVSAGGPRDSAES